MGFSCTNGVRECNGCMDCQPEFEALECPVCGKEAEDFYIDRQSGDVVGCDLCIAVRDAWEEALSAREAEQAQRYAI